MNIYSILYSNTSFFECILGDQWLKKKKKTYYYPNFTDEKTEI